MNPFALIGMTKLCDEYRVMIHQGSVLCHDHDLFFAAMEMFQATPEIDTTARSSGKNSYRFKFDGVEFSAFLTEEEAAKIS